MTFIYTGLPIPGAATDNDYPDMAFLAIVIDDPKHRAQCKTMYLAFDDGKWVGVAHLSRAYQTSVDRAQEVADELNSQPSGAFACVKVKALIGRPLACTIKVIKYELKDVP